MANQNTGGHQGSVRDPEHDGRLKENREEGRTKGTTPGSRERAEGKGEETKAAAPSRESGRGGDKGEGEAGMQGREYTDAAGNVHHHTKAYMEQHKGEQG